MSNFHESKIISILEDTYFGSTPDEEYEVGKLRDLLVGKSFFVDIGASLGQYTREAFRHMDKGKIIAVEPDPIRFTKLKENCENWSKETQVDVNVLNCAIDKVSGTADFWLTGSETSGSLTAVNKRKDSGRFVTVAVNTLDGVLSGILASNDHLLLKADVEGKEFGLLLSGAEILSKHNNIDLLLELHPWGDDTLRKYPHHCLRLLWKWGYKYKKIGSNYYFSKRLKLTRLAHLAAIFGWWYKAKVYRYVKFRF